MEVRYIVFTVEETRRAIISFVRTQYHNIKENIKEFEIVGHDEFPSVVVHLPGSPIAISTSDLVGLLLLYCRDHHIPIPQRSQKKVQHSSSGLTLVLTTTDLIEGGAPLVADGRITYRDDTMAQELRAVRQELTRTIARAEEAERKVAEADARVAIAEKASAEAAAFAPAASGLRGWALRLLIESKQSA
jgi:hypothetical protein